MYSKIKTWLKSKKNGILALVFSAILVITLTIPTSANDVPKVYNYELGRNVTSLYGFTCGEAYDISSTVYGLLATGNNYPATYPPTYGYTYYDGRIGGNLETVYNSWEVEQDYNGTPYTYFALGTYDVLDAPCSITISLTDFYIDVQYSQELETYLYDNIYFTFTEDYSLNPQELANGSIYYDMSFYDLVDVNVNGTIDNYHNQGEIYWDLAEGSNGRVELAVDILELFGEDSPIDHKLYYVEYLTIDFVLGEVYTSSNHSINVEFDLQQTVEFEYNTNTYSLTTQSDFDSFRMRQFAQGRYDGGTIPTDYFRPYADWLAQAVSGFFSFQLFPGFYLGGILVAIIAFCLVMWWLKMFGGG